MFSDDESLLLRALMKKKYIIQLLAEERQRLTDLVRKGKVAAYRRTHAQIRLFTDEGEPEPGLPDNKAVRREVTAWTFRAINSAMPLIGVLPPRMHE